MDRNQWLACVGITGWNGSESPAALRRNTQQALAGLRRNTQYELVISAYGLTNLAATVVLRGRMLPRQPQFLLFGENAVVGAGFILMQIAGWLLLTDWTLPGLMLEQRWVQLVSR